MSSIRHSTGAGGNVEREQESSKHSESSARVAVATAATAGSMADSEPIRPSKVPRERWAKLAATRLLIVVTLLITTRYVYWRWTQTMNPAARWFFYAFLIAEILNIVESILFFVTTWAPTRYNTPDPLPGRRVDVFIPTYDEDVELLRETILCASAIRYPHRTFILDDGNRPEVRDLAADFYCEYLARPDRKHAKAGNLNYALQHSDAEFIVTLDADHVPLPDLIDQLIGFFRDEKVGIVQAAQDFYNLDSFQHKMNWRRREGWQQQELFFNVIQPGKDSFDAAFYCGSPAMIRRSALDAVGGFATETITEDMHTGLRMQKNERRVIYHNRTVALGLAPQTFRGYATQWKRWGYGCMQVMRCENPIFGRGLSFGQRVCYFSSLYFYWMSFQKLLFLLTPIIALLAGVFPLVTTPRLFVLYFVPFMVLNLIVSAILQGGARSYLRSEEFNVLKMHLLFSSPIGLVRKTGTFKVTPKSRAEAASIADLIVPISLWLLMLSSVVIGAFRLVHSTDQFSFWAIVVNMFWSAFYLLIMGVVIKGALLRKEHRLRYRFPSRIDSPVSAYPLRAANTSPVITGFARNLNRSGMSLTTDSGLPIGTVLALKMELPDRFIEAEGEVVRHSFYKTSQGSRVANGIRFSKISTQDQDEISRYLFWQIAPRDMNMLRLTSRTKREEA